MFINSIFLPKTISEKILPEGISGKIDDFSHLFSNVFHIIKDDQEKSQPFNLDNLDAKSIEKTPNELLKVSLLSDNQSNLENINISTIVKTFLSKLNQEENDEDPININKTKVNDNVPKYFSLSKKEFIKELKDIIESLKSGDIKNLENVEISLIANGQSLKINPLSANIDEIEKWANEQLKSKNDFEILVKSGQKKLFVDIEPVKMESSKTFKPVEIVSINTSDDSYTQNKSIVENNRTELTPGFTNTSGLQGASKQLLESLKQTIVYAGDQTLKQEISTLQKQGNPPSSVNSKIIFEKNITSNESVIIKSEIQDKVVKNIPIANNNLVKEFISVSKYKLLTNTDSSLSKENVLINSKDLSQKEVIGENQVDTLIKDFSNELKVKPNFLRSGETLNNIKMNKKTSEVNIKKISNSEMKVTVKSNQKINSISTNKNAVQENTALNDLMKKADVKEIDVNIQKSLKTNSTNTPKIQNEYHSELSLIKNNTLKTKAPTLNDGVKKDILSNQEIKRPIVKKSLETGSVKTGKTLNSTSEQKQKITRPELNTKFTETIKVQNSQKFGGQQELVIEERLVNNEKSAGINPEKSDLPKIESIKTSLKNQPTIKVNSKIEDNKKIILENKNSVQNKTEYKPAELKSSPQNSFNENEVVKNEKSVLPKIESTKITLNGQQTDKINTVIEATTKSMVENKNLERIKTLQVDSIKPRVEINDSDISGKRISQEIKTEQKPVEFKSTAVITEDETVKAQNSITSKEAIKENVKESNNVSVATKTNTEAVKSETEKTELSASNNSKIVTKNTTERSVVENLRTSIKENLKNEAKPERFTKTQFENKNVKIDLMQRRVYSQIPQLEVIAEETEINNLKNTTQNIDANKNIRTMDESKNSTSFAAESKTNNEKQVWVKVSLEKPEVENSSEVKKQAPQQSKITIDANNDGIKKENKQNNFSEKESQESKNIKSQNISVETTQSTGQKSVDQSQSVNNQQDLITNIKPEIKTEHNHFKSTLNSEETGIISRVSEMAEKIKIISSSELVREVYKVFESGEKQSIILRLVPKELGSIKIMLDAIDNVLTAKVEVENESVGHIIRNNVDQLKQNLLQSGVHVNSINISYQNSDQKQSGFQNQKRRKSSFLYNNDIETIDESIVSKKMGYNTYEYLA